MKFTGLTRSAIQHAQTTKRTAQPHRDLKFPPLHKMMLPKHYEIKVHSESDNHHHLSLI